MVPAVLSGFTDAHYFRGKDIVSYGFTGLTIGEDDIRRVHGTDERLSLTSLREGITTLLEIMQELN